MLQGKSVIFFSFLMCQVKVDHLIEGVLYFSPINLQFFLQEF